MEEDGNELRTGSSAKIDQLITLLRLTPDNDKSLVFSQFTSFLDKVSFDRIYTYLSNLDLSFSRSRKPWTGKGTSISYKRLSGF